jgi:hypothetical protein
VQLLQHVAHTSTRCHCRLTTQKPASLRVFVFSRYEREDIPSTKLGMK